MYKRISGKTLKRIYLYKLENMQFEELKIWNEAQDLYNSLDDIFFQDSFRNYFFRDQILRATLSISNNIAE